MSAGPGRLERALGVALSGEWQTLRDLAAQVSACDEPTRSNVESVRRACRRMVKRGTAELDYIYKGYPTSPDSGTGELWSSIGGGRNAYHPEHRPAAPCWELVARARPASSSAPK